PLRIAERERMEDDVARDRKERGADREADRQRHDREGGLRGAATDPAERVANVEAEAHSYLSAAEGSIRDARHAGMQLATIATSVSVAATEAKTRGSVALIWKRVDA